MNGQKTAYVFVSYSAANKSQADAVHKILLSREIDHWMDQQDIPAGTNYAGEIERAIRECSCFLLLLTKESQESGHVAREVDRAISHKKTIVPMRLDDAPLNEAYSYYLGTCQMVSVLDITETNPAVQSVLERLESLIDADLTLPWAFMEMLDKWLDLPKNYIINQERANLLEWVCNEMKCLLSEEGNDCKLVVKPCPLGTGAASVSFTTCEMTVRKVKEFCDVVSRLDNFEIYPTEDGQVCFAGTMHGVSRALPIVEEQ